MNAPAVEIKKGRKFDQVLAGAREVFLRDGFEGASVDQIARAAGVSKATLYSYFPDKGILFMEVAKAECIVQAESAMSEIVPNASPREVLTNSAQKFMEFMLSDFGLQMFRVVVAEAGRFPALGREFFEAVPKTARNCMVAYFECAQKRGELKIDDMYLAADQFHELCKAQLHGQFLLGVKAEASEAEIDKVVTGAVDMFLARYGVNK